MAKAEVLPLPQTIPHSWGHHIQDLVQRSENGETQCWWNNHRRSIKVKVTLVNIITIGRCICWLLAVSIKYFCFSTCLVHGRVAFTHPIYIGYAHYFRRKKCKQKCKVSLPGWHSNRQTVIYDILWYGYYGLTGWDDYTEQSSMTIFVRRVCKKEKNDCWVKLLRCGGCLLLKHKSTYPSFFLYKAQN